MLEHEPQRLDWSRTETRLIGDAELGGIAAAGGVEIARRLALEVVADAAVDVRRLAGDAEQPLAVLVGLGPHRAARAAAMHDAVRHAAQRNLGAVRERRGFRQPLQPRRDPAAVLLREFLGFPDAAARRHGEHHLARGGVDAQRVAARLPVPPDAHEIDRPVEDDLNRLTARSDGDRATRAATWPRSTQKKPRAK